MDNLLIELAKLRRDSNLTESIQDVDKILEQLEAARESIVQDPHSASFTLAKLQNPLKHGFDKVNEDLKKVHKGQSAYGRALDKNLPHKELPFDINGLASRPTLINRAISMHLLREGQFQVASTFLDEAQDNPPQPSPMPGTPSFSEIDETELPSLKSRELQDKFSNMYTILNELKAQNLHPAIEWARANSQELEKRGSNLEFELSKLQFVWLFLGPSVNGLPNDMNNGLPGALIYAQQHFQRFQARFLKDIQQLATAMAYSSNLQDSPYYRTFDIETAWDDVSTSFTREFCSLLGLSAESPLYLAATAGAIALPTLLKLYAIVKEKRTEWTTRSELPVEIALPKSMIFHAIFVCPVSKEQTTDQNPPMMMPCGHVIAKESLQKLSKGGKFKCPYCPGESIPSQAREIIL
ncbi:LisH domain-containing protein [Lachnellula occidentalis]|uniref:GID complex catalytic subunit 2 n=1 Tax=Lachnellula occidentalis TaxID=215460 RepID=A0A8H8SAE3_9HELO|nr:LisH domain-containing protein [Lachnellula occidentalis]